LLLRINRLLDDFSNNAAGPAFRPTVRPASTRLGAYFSTKRKKPAEAGFLWSLLLKLSITR